MSDVGRALEQIAEIHEQIQRSSWYRGWRSVPVALSGVTGLAAAAWQSRTGAWLDPWSFTVYWLAVGVAALLVAASEIVWHYAARANNTERARAREVFGQLLPAVMAGALVTAAFVRLDLALVALLPGLWALFFGVGVFATRPHTPRASGWVGLYYWTTGVALLWTAAGTSRLSGWSVGGTFGVGQLLAAAVIYLQLERPMRRDRTGDDEDDDDDTKA